MKTTEKKSLFTAITEEESAAVCGGFGLSITLYNPQIYSDQNSFLDAAAAYGIDLNALKQQLAAVESGDQQ